MFKIKEVENLTAGLEEDKIKKIVLKVFVKCGCSILVYLQVAIMIKIHIGQRGNTVKAGEKHNKIA